MSSAQDASVGTHGAERRIVWYVTMKPLHDCLPVSQREAANTRHLWPLDETLSSSSAYDLRDQKGEKPCQLRMAALEAETDLESGDEETQNTMRRRQYYGRYEEALVWTLSRLLPERGKSEKTLL
ncbi:hypothetical protein PSPO01_09838 [Paraphaeosphaeria sporulosa]